MAGPIIQMLQGLRARRQRRRSGWGGGDAPGMRNIINPLDSQQMSDRAQGVDISSAMPATRLETRVAGPVADSFATGQLPQPAASSTVTPPQVEPQLERRGPFMTAAGSNANPQPMGGSQYPQQPQYFERPGVCTGPNCQQGGGERIINERVTHINGVPVEQLQGQGAVSGAPQPMSQPAGAAMASPVPASPASAWNDFVSRGAADPKSVNWIGAANAAASQADSFDRLHGSAASPSWKLYYGQQAQYWRRESFNALKTHMLAQNLGPRQKLAEQAMNRGSLRSRFQEADDFLTTPSMDVRPDDRAAAYASTVNPNLTPEELTASPTYQEGRRRAYAADIAYGAALASTANENLFPWGTEESRGAGISSAWNSAREYYGNMSLADANNEIHTRFKPAYMRSLLESDMSLPPEQRRGEAALRDKAELDSQALVSLLAYDQNPSLGMEAPPRPAPSAPAKTEQAPAPASHPYRRSGPIVPSGPTTGRGQSLKRNTEWMK